ncbi:MAG: metal-dependent hydrolase [Candidatus Aenigmarchaeota archaeon]|nr:metal-dependent hydrolase [Candidatus Aenigmarchaeota archaeon]
MNLLVHLAVAVFTGFFASDFRLALLIVIAQLLPVTDVLLKYVFGYEPLHTVWGYTVMGFIFEANLPFIYHYLMVSYLLHIVLDALTAKGVGLFAPWSERRISYPVENGEKIVLFTSLVGAVVIVVVKFL